MLRAISSIWIDFLQSRFDFIANFPDFKAVFLYLDKNSSGCLIPKMKPQTTPSRTKSVTISFDSLMIRTEIRPYINQASGEFLNLDTYSCVDLY